MVKLPSIIGLAEAKDVMRPLQKALAAEPAGPLVVDAAGLQQFDSAALAVVLECRRIASAAGRPFELRGSPPRLSQLARLYGVADLLGIEAAPAAPATQPG